MRLFRLIGFVLALLLSSPALAEESVEKPAAGELQEVEPRAGEWTDLRLSGEEFAGRSGYFHPFLSVGEYYTDNLFNEPGGEEEDFVTVISPGAWVAFPASDRPPLDVTTRHSAPGGLEVTRFPGERRRRLQGYALYRADITRHQEFDSEDNVYHRGEALLSLNLRGGLSMELLDIFQIDHDPYGTGPLRTERELDEFTSNLIHLLTQYKIGPKTLVRADVARFSLDFDSERNAFRERDDLTASLFLLYRFLPKTSLLLQYVLNDIDYQEDVLGDRREHRGMGGVVWGLTARSRATIKLGYNTRDIDGGDSRGDLVAEVRLDHRISPKTSVHLQFTRQVEETDIESTQEILSNRFQAEYRQKLAARWFGSLDLFYVHDNYRGELTQDGLTAEPREVTYGAGVGLAYHFRPWLNFGATYDYEKRDSNFTSSDYTTNTVYLTITAAL